MSEAPQETITRIYNCPKCKKTHSITLERSIADNRNRYPFPHVFIHSSQGNIDDLLTILYIDAQLQIRAVDIIELENSNVFSEDLAKEIMDKLMNEINKLQEENLELKGLLSNIEINESIDLAEEPSNLEVKQTAEIRDEELPKKNLSEATEEDVEESAELKEVEENVYTFKSKTPGRKIIPKGEKLTLFFVSTIGPGEKKQKLAVNTGNVIYDIKETIGHIYGLIPSTFHFSLGGLTLDETKLLKEYAIAEGDELLIIPASTAG